MKKKIYAKDFLKKLDFYHLAKQFYKHIYRHTELEEKTEWQEIKLVTENYLVEHRLYNDSKTTPEEYREFLRFYTELEIKYEEPTEFIFSDLEKKIYLKLLVR